MLSKQIENEEKPENCWQRGIAQPVGMAVGSAVNLSGGIASLVLSAQSQTINPIPFICTGMLTSALYLGSNIYRASQICAETRQRIDPEEQESPINFEEKIKRERDKKITITIER